jgi:hypothetical protein
MIFLEWEKSPTLVKGGKLMDETHGVALAKALSHPIRVRILMSMNAPKRRLSPVGYSDETDEMLSKSAYHFRCLKDAGLIELVDKIPRRGSFEHVYEATAKAMAWTKTWEALPSVVKQTFTATVLSGFVLAVGDAVDAGTFEARNSHFSWSSMRVDEEGWSKMLAILQRSLEEMIELEEESADRLGEGEGFIASFALSGFESPDLSGNTPRT